MEHEHPSDTGGAASSGDARGVILPELIKDVEDEEAESDEECDQAFLNMLTTIGNNTNEEYKIMDTNHVLPDFVLTAIEEKVIAEFKKNDLHDGVTYEIGLEGSMARSHERGAEISVGDVLVFKL